MGLFELGSRAREEGWRAFVRGALAELARGGRRGPPRARGDKRATCRSERARSRPRRSACALTLALLAVSGSPDPDRLELALLCSRVENDWVGARTGLLDQMAALFGSPGEAVRIDMASLDVAPVPLDLRGATLATLDSGARHEHAGSGYNARRAECAAICRALGLASLRDALPEDVERLPEPLAGRARHVLRENERVDAMVAALWRGDVDAVGGLLDASHASLRDDYDVSLPAVEETVRRAKEAGALGARLVGGGFGGNVLALFPPGADLPAEARVVRPGQGGPAAISSAPMDRRLAYRNLRTGLIAGAVCFIVFAAAFVTGLVY